MYSEIKTHQLLVLKNSIAKSKTQRNVCYTSNTYMIYYFKYNHARQLRQYDSKLKLMNHNFLVDKETPKINCNDYESQ